MGWCVIKGRRDAIPLHHPTRQVIKMLVKIGDFVALVSSVTRKYLIHGSS